MKLLSINSDAKTVKGLSQGYLTAVMYLTPAHGMQAHGFPLANLCPRATAGCILACLNTAGRAAFEKAIPLARAERTRLYLRDKRSFMALLAKEIGAFERRAGRAGLIPAVRLNGTSDIPFERNHAIFGASSIFELFPGIRFYDYTKIVGRLGKVPSNYHLTLSYAEGRPADTAKAFSLGVNVARVFRNAHRPTLPARFWDLPESFSGSPLYDGDQSDLRFTDPPGGNWIGLKAKGKATLDSSGFVTDIEPLP